MAAVGQREEWALAAAVVVVGVPTVFVAGQAGRRHTLSTSTLCEFSSQKRFKVIFYSTYALWGQCQQGTVL